MNATLEDLEGTPALKYRQHAHWRYRYLCAKVNEAQLLEKMLQQARIEMARRVRTMGKKRFKKLSDLIKRFEPV